MIADRLLDEMARAGITATVEGDRIRLRAASGSLPPELVERARRQRDDLLLALRGWVRVRSEVLGEEILLLRDEDVAPPPEHAHRVAYTLAECAALYDATPEVLCNLHRVKEEFRGSRVLGAGGHL